MKKKVFVGRENELEMFRSSMRKLTAKKFPGEAFARTFLVYGVGGMGKTSLCNRFMIIVAEEFPSLHPVFVDWDLCKNHGSTFTPEELLDAVARELEKEFHSEIKPYSGAKKDIKAEQEKIQKILDRNMHLLEQVSGLAEKAMTVGTGIPILGSLASTGLSFIGKGLSAADEKILKERAGISDDKWRLFKDPAAALADRLLECIEKITAKKERRLILVLDTCELIAESEEWFTERFLVKLINENRNVALVFSGRNNPYSQRPIKIGGQSRDIREIRGMADLLSFSPYSIDMLVFSRKDIEKYFNEMGLVIVDEQVTDFVQTYSRGVPYAVDLLTNAMDRIGTERFVKDFDAEEFREQLKKTSSEEDVIRCISRRFLKYCLDEPGEKHDRDRIFTIAALQDMDSAVLKAVWGVEKPFDLLQELQAKYALFIRDNKLHDVVKDFLVEYLIENKNLRDDVIRPAMAKALPIYRQKYEAECEKEPIWEDRAREPRWKEALLKLMNALVWYSPDDAAEFFIHRGIELFLISSSLVRELKGLLNIFLETGDDVHGRDRNKIYALVDALNVFEWWIWGDKDRKELPRVLSFCIEALGEWKLVPVHSAILHLIKGRTEYHLKNYDSAFNTLLVKVDGMLLDKSLKNKLAEGATEVGLKFCVNENNLFFFSEKAMEAFTRVVQLDEKKSIYFYHLAMMFVLERNYAKAIEFCKKAIELDPKEAVSYYGIGNVYYNLEDYNKAFEMYQKAIELDPQFAAIYNGIGNVYSVLEKYDKAIEMYQKAIYLDPKFAHAYNGSGNVYMDLKKYDKAIEMYQKAIELDPKFALPYNGLGYACSGLMEYEKAIEMYRKAIELDPKYTYAYYGLGYVYCNLEDYNKAIEMFQKAIGLDPKFALPYNGLGNVYFAIKEYEKALDMYQKAIELDPKLTLAYNGSGNVYSALKSYDKAIEMYQKAIEIDPKYAYPYNGLGNVYSDLEEYDRAIEMYRKAIDIDPKFALPYCGSGEVYYNLEDYNKTIVMYQKAIELDPHDASPHDELGYLYLHLGHYPEAITYLEKSVELEPNIAGYVNLGIAYYRLGDVETGISYFEKTLSLSMDISPIETVLQLCKVIALSGLDRYEEAHSLLVHIEKNTVSSREKNDFLAVLNILSGASQPPKGITAVIQKAEEMWGRD